MVGPHLCTHDPISALIASQRDWVQVAARALADVVDEVRLADHLNEERRAKGINAKASFRLSLLEALDTAVAARGH